MTVEFAGTAHAGALRRGRRLAPAAILVGCALIAVALARAKLSDSWRESGEARHTAPAPTDAEALARIEPAALAASGGDGVYRLVRD